MLIDFKRPGRMAYDAAGLALITAYAPWFLNVVAAAVAALFVLMVMLKLEARKGAAIRAMADADYHTRRRMNRSR
jgi:hypothetical protein